MFTKAYLKDLLERVVTTFALAFVGVYVTASQIDLTTQEVAAVAGVSAVLSLIKNIVTQLAGVENGRSWYQDALLRTMWTYAQVWIGLVLVNGSLDTTQLRPAAIAALPAALSVLKGYLASYVGDHDTAGFLSNSGHDVVQGEVIPPVDEGDAG